MQSVCVNYGKNVFEFFFQACRSEAGVIYAVGYGDTDDDDAAAAADADDDNDTRIESLNEGEILRSLFLDFFTLPRTFSKNIAAASVTRCRL